VWLVGGGVLCWFGFCFGGFCVFFFVVGAPTKKKGVSFGTVRGEGVGGGVRGRLWNLCLCG